VIGAFPSGLTGVERATRFDHFQRLAGQLETASASNFPALHAVCHALMNGIPEVHVFGIGEVESRSEWLAALAEAVELDSAHILVAGTPAELVHDLAKHFTSTARQATLWLPSSAPRDPIKSLEYRESLPGGRNEVRLALPAVDTISPGRRGMEPLDATCLILPLVMKRVEHLRGVHELPRAPSSQVIRRLDEAGFGLLAPLGRRRVAGLALPVQERTPPAPYSVSDEIQEAVDRVVQTFVGQAVGPGLWKRVERDVKGVMYRFRKTKQISAFSVRCDDETNMDVTDGVAVEVAFSTPKRVKEVIIRVSSF